MKILDGIVAVQIIITGKENANTSRKQNVLSEVCYVKMMMRIKKGWCKMVNQKGEFPRTERVSVRVTARTKRLLETLKKKGHSEADVIDYAASQLAKEPVLLEWEIGELELKMIDNEKEGLELKALHQAKLNRLKQIAPKLIDEDTLNSMMVESAKDYVKEMVRRAEKMDFVLSIEDFNNHDTIRVIRSTGEEWGYNPDSFLDEVKKQAGIILSDISV